MTEKKKTRVGKSYLRERQRGKEKERAYVQVMFAASFCFFLLRLPERGGS